MTEYHNIPGFPGYRVGSDGSVWSCWHHEGWGGAQIIPGRWKRKKFRLDKKHGRPKVTLSRRNISYEIFVYRLVLLAFVGPCPKGMECRHFDGDKTNSKLSNLRWGTRKENEADKIRHGTDNRGERNGQAKLTRSKVNAIRKQHRQGGCTQRQLARRHGVSPPTIHRVLHDEESWKP